MVEQLVVRADRRDAALLQHGNAIGAPYRREPVRDHHHGAALHQVGQRRLHQRLALRVERRGRLVQNQDGRVLEDGAGNGDALLLAAGKPKSFFADHGIVALRHVHNEIVRQCVARRLFHQRALRVRLAVSDVVVHRVVEEDGLLRDLRHLAPQRGQRQIAQVVAVNQNAAEVTSKKRGIKLTSVDFPAPLGPTRASTSPAFTSRSTL